MIMRRMRRVHAVGRAPVAAVAEPASELGLLGPPEGNSASAISPGRRAAHDAVRALGGILPSEDPDYVPDLKAREVVATGPKSLQKILQSCDRYVNKCEGKDKELGGACRLVRELSKEVREQVEIISQLSSESASEHDRMSTLLEEYLSVFTNDESLKMDLSAALGPEWAKRHKHHVLTPRVLLDALTACVSAIHQLRREVVNSKAQRALDLPKFERAVTTLTLEKDHEIQGLKETIDGLRETIERERAGYLTSDVAARREAAALRLKQTKTEEAAAAAQRAAHEQIASLQAEVARLHEEAREQKLQAAKNAARIHQTHISLLSEDAEEWIHSRTIY